MKPRVYVITLLLISATMLILSTSSGSVFADPCTATLSYPVMPAQYSNSNVPIEVPISASCSTYYGNQLYATGSAYDTTSNVNLGSASTVLSSVNGGTEFNGQLGFSLAPTSPGDSLQISVSLYDSPGGTLITTASETAQVGTAVQQVQPIEQITTTTVTENPYYTPYLAAYQPSQQPNQLQYYQSQPQYQNQNQNHHQTHYFSQFFGRNSSNASLLDYAVMIAIISAVIVATAGLVLIARRQQPAWYPVAQPPPR